MCFCSLERTIRAGFRRTTGVTWIARRLAALFWLLCSPQSAHLAFSHIYMPWLFVFLAFLASATADETCVFEHARLFNETGHPVTCADLGGLSVALYFAGEWCPLCRRFTPALRSFHAQWRESVQIVFISSDLSEADAKKHYQRQAGSWLMLAWNDPVASALKRRHRVWSGRELSEFGARRRSGVPAVVVIDKTGAELSFLPGERFGAAALAEWDPSEAEDRTWPRAAPKSEL